MWPRQGVGGVAGRILEAILLVGNKTGMPNSTPYDSALPWRLPPVQQGKKKKWEVEENHFVQAM